MTLPLWSLPCDLFHLAFKKGVDETLQGMLRGGEGKKGEGKGDKKSGRGIGGGEGGLGTSHHLSPCMALQ